MKNQKEKELEELRADVELIDTIIVSLLAKREKISLEIGKIKIKEGKPIVDKALENEKIAKAARVAKNLGMGYFSQRFAEKVIHKIIVYCRKKQQSQERRAKDRR